MPPTIDKPDGNEVSAHRETKPRFLSGFLVTIASLFALVAPLHGDSANLSQSLSLQLSPAVDLTVPASLTLINAGTIFNSYSGSETAQFRVRTTPTGTGAALTVQATAEFSPASGPKIANNTLTYTCSGATKGTACGGSQTVSLSSAKSVLTVPAGACTGGGGSCGASNPNSVGINFTLTNDPAYKTGNYSCTLTFTFSST